MYNPINAQVYVAAFTGAYSGMFNGRIPLSVDASLYTGIAITAASFAQQFDTVWGAAPPNAIDISQIEQICFSAWSERHIPIPVITPTTFTTLCLAIISTIQSADTFLLGQGINPNANPYLLQPKWFIDPQNSSGTASNANDGASLLTPLLNWKEVIRRYGTFTPILSQNTTWQFMSGSPLDGSDPVVFAPVMILNAKALIIASVGNAQKLGSGVLSGVVAKNYAAGTLLEAVLTSAGAVGSDMLIVNTTAGKASRGWSNLPLGGGLFSLLQTMAPADPTLAAPPFVDTWANGDTFDAFNLVRVEIVSFQPIVTDFSGGATPNRPEIRNINIADVTGTGVGGVYISDGVAIVECKCERRMVMIRSAYARHVSVINSDFTNAFGFTGGPSSAGIGLGTSNIQGPRIVGGAMAYNVNCGLIDGNCVTRAYGGAASIACSGSVLGTVYIETGLATGNTCGLFAFAYDGPRVWGPGILNVEEGRLSISGDTAVNALLITGGIQIGSKATAFTATKANPSVINGNVAITPAAIDANAPPGGVGMFDAGGGACIVTGLGGQ